MTTRDEAMQKVLSLLSSRRPNHVPCPGGVRIIESETQERPYGWIFHYNSNEYLDTGDHRACLVGQGPVVVLAATGEIHELGSRLHPDLAVAELERELGLTR